VFNNLSINNKEENYNKNRTLAVTNFLGSLELKLYVSKRVSKINIKTWAG
jgi:hypothetical protein